MKYIQQISQWEPETKLEITGEQFTRFNEIYEKLHMIMNDIFEYNINAGNITVKYIDSEGNSVSQEEIEKMISEAENQIN